MSGPPSVSLPVLGWAVAAPCGPGPSVPKVHWEGGGSGIKFLFSDAVFCVPGGGGRGGGAGSGAGPRAPAVGREKRRLLI